MRHDNDIVTIDDIVATPIPPEEPKDTREYLPEGHMMSVLLWSKGEPDENGAPKEKHMTFPITRYLDVLNRPRYIAENKSVSTTASGEFHLVATGVEEVDDDVIYDYFKQTW